MPEEKWCTTRAQQEYTLLTQTPMDVEILKTHAAGAKEKEDHRSSHGCWETQTYIKRRIKESLSAKLHKAPLLLIPKWYLEPAVETQCTNQS